MILNNNLINKCVCGNKTDFTATTTNQIPTLTCNNCGVVHQELKNWSEADLINFYSKEYHEDFQSKKGVVSYHKRYEHDCKISDIRLAAYKNFLPERSRGLDVGSSNSAFIHRAMKQGYECMGLEPGDNIGDPICTIKGTLQTIDPNIKKFQWMTLHDSIEHMVDVNSSLKIIHKLLDKDGLLIIDLPDFWQPQGLHHWKHIEHLWFFTQNQFETLLNKHKFQVQKITRPVPGKLVFYAFKD